MSKFPLLHAQLSFWDFMPEFWSFLSFSSCPFFSPLLICSVSFVRCLFLLPHLSPPLYSSHPLINPTFTFLVQSDRLSLPSVSSSSLTITQILSLLTLQPHLTDSTSRSLSFVTPIHVTLVRSSVLHGPTLATLKYCRFNAI